MTIENFYCAPGCFLLISSTIVVVVDSLRKDDDKLRQKRIVQSYENNELYMDVLCDEDECVCEDDG